MGASGSNGKSRRSAFRLESSAVAWDELLLKLPNPHPLQSWSWGAFKGRWGWSGSPLVLDINGEEAGRPPLAAALVLKRRVPRLPFSILYVSKGPTLDYNNPALRRVMLAQLEQLARAEKAIFIKIDPNVVYSWGLEEGSRSPIGARFIDELRFRGWRLSEDQIQFRNTVELNLDRSEEELLAAMKQKTRYNIRLAGRKGVLVRPGAPEDFGAVANMYLETAARDHFAVRPVAYYLDAWQSLYEAGMAHPLLAEYEGELLAAVIIVRFGERAVYMYGASSTKERRRMPNYLLQWEAIRWAKAQGCRVYDFWGAPDDFVESDPLWGVWRFKSGFNGQIVRHIGAWDYPARPFWYWVYNVLIPKYLSFLRNRNDPQAT
jgi:peptidoglycan pentaglycine glycine transferase (the first glycine)